MFRLTAHGICDHTVLVNEWPSYTVQGTRISCMPMIMLTTCIFHKSEPSRIISIFGRRSFFFTRPAASSCPVSVVTRDIYMEGSNKPSIQGAEMSQCYLQWNPSWVKRDADRIKIHFSRSSIRQCKGFTTIVSWRVSNTSGYTVYLDMYQVWYAIYVGMDAYVRERLLYLDLEPLNHRCWISLSRTRRIHAMAWLRGKFSYRKGSWKNDSWLFGRRLRRSITEV